MRSPAAAIAWQFAHRHRWGLAAVALYVLGLALVRVFILEHGAVNPLESEKFAFTVNVPMTCAFIYLLAIFSFGLEGDVGSRQSLYPTRMFTLPVSTSALAGWPMLYGAVAMAGLWIASVVLALRPSGINFPVVWPALFAAGFIAWTQALMWLPYGLRNLRVIMAVLLLCMVDVVVILAVYAKTPNTLMIAVMAPQVPLAFLVGRHAVALARRGVVPEWRIPFTRVGSAAEAVRAHFSSAARAQLWFEWKRHGRALPMLVAVLVPFELGLVFTPGGDTPGALFEMLVLVLITPPLMAIFAAANVRKASPDASDAYGLTAFIATRPLHDSSLVSATLKAALLSTLLAWLIVFVATALALTLSGTWPVLTDGVQRFVDTVRPGRALVLAIVVVVALIASTWKQLVQSLCIGFTGREGLVKASVFGTLALIVVLIPVLQWIGRSGAAQAVLWDATRWIPAVLVAIKMSLAFFLAIRLYDRGVLGGRALLTGATTWLLAVLLVYSLLVWAMDTPHVARYWLALVAILLVPLNRVSAAPLALAWNRHR